MSPARSLGNKVNVYSRVGLGSQASQQDVGLGMHVGFFLGNFSTIHQCLYVGVILCALEETVSVVVVNP